MDGWKSLSSPQTRAEKEREEEREGGGEKKESG